MSFLNTNDAEQTVARRAADRAFPEVHVTRGGRVNGAVIPNRTMPFSLTTTGNPDDGFTAVEIEIDGDYVGRIFELESGWYVHVQTPQVMQNNEFIEAVLAAKERLLHYVNRKGGDFTDGISRAGASLWLMQRDDGKGFTLPATE